MPAATSRLRAVEQRIVEYHGADLSDVLEAIAYLRDEGDSVVLGGSLTLGLGNRLSDLDVVISGDSSAESSRVPLQHWIGTLRVDVWKLRHDALDELLARAEGALDAEGPVDGAFGDQFEEADLKLLHRVAFGIPVEGAPPSPPTRRSHRDVAADLLTREYAERMRECALVAQLASVAGDPLAATTQARRALESALHAAAYSAGLPFTGDKWLRERLDADAPGLAALLARFAVLPEDDAERYVADALGECARLSGLDLDLAALLASVTLDPGDLVLFAPGAARFLVSPGRDGLWEIDADEAATWERLRPGAPWTCAADDAPGLALTFALHALGVGRLTWERGLPVAALGFERGTDA